MKIIKRFVNTSYIALKDTISHDGIEHAGYIAFLSLLSFFPFLVFFFAVLSFLSNTDIGVNVIGNILNNHFLPQHVTEALKPRISEIISGPPQSILTLSILGAIWTSSSMVEGLRTILNRAYRVDSPPAYISRRLMSILQFLIITGVITFATLLFIITPNLLKNIHVFLVPEAIEQVKVFFSKYSYEIFKLNILRYITTILLIFLMVAASYFVIPNIKQRWNDIAPGALYVSILWSITGTLFTQYLSNFKQVHIIYGSLGGIIATLLFFYISGIIYVFGAEFNYHLANVKGHKLQEKIVN